MKKVYIARHGLTDWNLIPKVQGITDIPLNEGGKKQANALAEMVKETGIHFDKILHSPLQRAAETAKIVAEVNNIPLQVEPRLIEQNFGKWEGFENNKKDSSFEEAKKYFFDSYGNGESMARLAQRIYNFLDELKEIPGDETYLLVTHGGIARCINSYFFNMTNDEYASFQMGNCEIREYKF
ncbi:MAG: histidine phosphatase family protein [Treponema sp.]|nr:histidine phosphatase family protein [Treponema sp.]